MSMPLVDLASSFLCCGSKFCRYSIWNEHHANDALFRVHTIIASEVRCHPREPARVRACLLLEGGHERELWQKESDAPVQLAASALPVGVQQGRSEPAGDPAPLYECPRPTDGSCCMRVSGTDLDSFLITIRNNQSRFYGAEWHGDLRVSRSCQ